jgi:hypothetical protein
LRTSNSLTVRCNLSSSSSAACSFMFVIRVLLPSAFPLPLQPPLPSADARQSAVCQAPVDPYGSPKAAQALLPAEMQSRPVPVSLRVPPARLCLPDSLTAVAAPQLQADGRRHSPCLQCDCWACGACESP